MTAPDGFIITDPSDADLLTMYRTMRATQLDMLQRAFMLDLETLTNPESRAFVERRLRLIQQVLAEL